MNPSVGYFTASSSVRADVTGAAATLVRNDRPFSELGEELDAIAKVTDADLNALVRDVVALERGLLVLVGDKTSILAQLEGLDLPTPIELTVTADPVID